MVQKALYPEGKGVCHVVMLHPPAGVAGGDHLNIDIRIGQHAQAVVTTPGATRWYKSNGHPSSQYVDIQIDENAHLDYLPCENIFFNQVIANTALNIHQSIGSSLIAWEMMQLGRVAAGENWSESRLKFSTALYLEKQLVWVDCSGLDSCSMSRFSPSGLDGYEVFGTMWFSSKKVTREMSETLSANLPWSPGLRAGVTHINLGHDHSLMVIRALTHETEQIRDLFIEAWLQMREAVCGLPPQPLRLWRT